MLNESQIQRGHLIDIQRLRNHIDNGPYDAVIVMSPENVPYYSGFYNFDLRGIPERVHFVVWPRGGEPAWVVTDRRKQFLVPGETYIEDVRTYQGEGYEMLDTVAEVLRDRGVANGTIGYEGRNFPAGHMAELQKRVPGATFVDAFSFLEKPRLIKTPGEIELLETLAKWTTDAIDAAFRNAKPGDTERKVVAEMQHRLLMNGADMIAFPTIGAGDRTGYFHGLGTDKVLEEGMLVKTDFGGYKDGYYSDLAREVVIGKASDRQKDIHAKLTEVKHRTIDAIKPGVLASEVAEATRRFYKELGLEFKWNIIGHSIGLGIHEAPQIYPWVHEPFEVGMAMMIEIGYNDFPNDSFHIEDLIVVTENGAEYRSDYKSHEKLWEVGV